MNDRATQNANVERTQKGWKLEIQKGNSSSYRDAQLDDYSQLPRHKFPHHELSLSLRAKASSNSIAGTWGFGLWNDPFGLSLGFGGNPFRLPALPNAVWFFSASPQNYLSFTNDKPANGFLAQTFRSPKFHLLLILAGLALPFSRKTTRRLLSKVIQEDSISLWNTGTSTGHMSSLMSRQQAVGLQSQGMDVTQWHRYRLEWSVKRVLFYVDDALMFESPVSPKPPLGVILWIDNQYAAFSPEGKVAFGVLQGAEEWLEIEELEIK